MALFRLQKVRKFAIMHDTMSFAVIKSGGKQHKVAKDLIFNVELLDQYKEGDEVTFDEVLMHSDGEKISVGTPTVAGKVVKAKVIEHGKGPKLSIVRFRAKSNFRRKIGHRQPYTKLQVISI